MPPRALSDRIVPPVFVVALPILAACLSTLWPSPAASASWTDAPGVLASCEEPSPPCLGPAGGREIFLDPSAPPTRVCTVPLGERDCPFIDRDAAVEALESGDTLVVLPGVHSITDGWEIRELHGTPCRPITIRGEKNGDRQAVLSGAVDVEWRRAERGPGGKPIPEGLRVFVTEGPATGSFPHFGGSLEVEGFGRVRLSRYPSWQDFVSPEQDLRLVERQVTEVDEDGVCSVRTISARDGDAGTYMGPGLYRDEDARRLYLRLDPSRTKAHLGLPAEDPTDPGRVAIFPLVRDLRVSLHDVSHVTIRDLALRDANALYLGGGTHHVDLADLDLDVMRLRIRSDASEIRIGGCREASCATALPELCPDEEACFCSNWRNTCFVRSDPPHHIRLRGVRVDNGFPPWVFWSDLKWASAARRDTSVCEGDALGEPCYCEIFEETGEPIYELRGTEMNPGRYDHHVALFGISRERLALTEPPWPEEPYCIDVGSSTFEDGWFGPYVAHGERVRIASSEMLRIHDDAVLIRDPTHQVEVAHNTMRDVFSAVSSTGAGEADDRSEEGEILIHHNVIDMRRPGDPKNLLACVRPGDHELQPSWDLFDADGDGENDGFCTNIVFAGHGEWGMRFDVYANTILVENGNQYGALSGIKQDFDASSPAHFVGNILVQYAPGVPFYGGVRYDHFDGQPGERCDDATGLQVIDGNIYWREGARASDCHGGDCCRPQELTELAADQEEVQLFLLRGPDGDASYATLTHFLCDAPTRGEPQGLAARSACGYDLGCPRDTVCGVERNEHLSRVEDPRIRDADYRPRTDVSARVLPPPEIDWPEGDWPWIGARAPLLEGEDCTRFRPENLEVKEVGGHWTVVDGRHGLFGFEDREPAERIREILRRYRADQSCFVGRPDPSLTYLLVGGRAPVGPFPGEECREIDRELLEVRRTGPSWRLRLAPGTELDFDVEDEARRSLEIVRTHDFRHLCTMGEHAAVYRYFRR